MALCIAGGAMLAQIAASGFTLAWTHSVERIPWQEDWRIEAGRLVLETARVKGSGAGIDPPPEARLENGWYVWHPRETRAEIILRRAPEVDDWRICVEGTECRRLGDIVGEKADPVRVFSCG